jgi:hypothetical protein
MMKTARSPLGRPISIPETALWLDSAATAAFAAAAAQAPVV